MSPNPAKSFTAVLEPLESALGWVVARIPFDVAKAWPVRKGLRVRGEIASANGKTNSKSEAAKNESGGFAFRSSLFGYAGGEGHFLLVNKKMQAAAKAEIGSKVRIRLEPDLEERATALPPELERALKGDRRLRRWFDKLSPSMRREIGGWVNEPKSAATREQRAERMAERLLFAMEGETELPPILQAAFLRQPLARAGWQAMTAVQRRNHLLGIHYYQSVEARERRCEKAVEDALRAAKKGGSATERGGHRAD